MFNEKGKKLSEEDLEYWNRLKETLDFKFYKKLNQITNLEKICNPINTLKLYENHNDHLDPDSIYHIIHDLLVYFV